ncbi:MAG: hypothetical protein ACRCUS_08275 [Anaerovoracaceae bacterium]
MNLAVVKAKVFGLRESKLKERIISGRLSTLENIKNNGEKIYSSWNANFVGKAYEKAKILRERDFIVIVSGTIDNTFSKEKNELFVNVTIYDFEIITFAKEY